MYLSALARMKHPSIEAISKALYDDRTVVRHHAMRRTLWVFTPQMARWAHAACTTALATTEWKRLAKMVEESGIASDGAAWVATARADTLAALTSMGTATARQLGKAVPALTEKLQLAVGKPYAATQGAHTRLLLNLGFDGAIVRGRPKPSWTNSEYPWSVTDQWLPRWDRRRGRRHRRRRTGAQLPRSLRSGDARRPAVVGRLDGRHDPQRARPRSTRSRWTSTTEGSGGCWPDDVDDDLREPEPWIAFLPALDPTTMGWKQRAWYLGDLATFGGPVFDRNGNAGPTIWMDGRVVGGWAQRKSGEISYSAARRRADEAGEGDRRPRPHGCAS